MYTMESMLRSGSTAIVPAGAAGSITDAAPTKHAASRLQIFPRRCVYIQRGPAGFSLSDGFPRIRRVSGHGVPSEPLVAQSLRKSVKIGLHQSESTLGCLILITAIHHVRNFLPPHVCFDLFLSGAVTVKDEVPCGRAQTAAAEPGPSAQLCTQATAPELRESELADCRAERVTLGEGGVQAC